MQKARIGEIYKLLGDISQECWESRETIIAGLIDLCRRDIAIEGRLFDDGHHIGNIHIPHNRR